MKNIIITGISGFIGSALKFHLMKDYRIIGIDRVGNVEKTTKDFYLNDINDCLPNLEGEDIYAVIHLAALPGVRDSHERFDQVCKDNILATQRVIAKCVSHWIPEKLLIASSSSVYGDLGRDGHALKESDGVSPRSPYAMSKVADEQLLQAYKNCGMLDGIDAIAMRFFTVYGPNQRNELAIRAFIDWMLQDKPITLYGDGNQKRDFTHINDICRGIKALLETKYIAPTHNVCNIGSGKSFSINEIILKIALYLDKKVTIDYQPRNRYDVDYTKADSNLLYCITSKIGKPRPDGSKPFGGGWKPEIDFDEGLKEQIEWQRRQLIINK